MLKTKKQNGFTLIELLVVVAIIGMLLSVIMISFTESRKKSRDAKRLSDMQQIKTGLEIYYGTGTGYPDLSDWAAAESTGAVLICNGVETFRIPRDISNNILLGLVYDYQTDGTSLAGCGGTVWSNFKVTFNTEGTTSLGPAGTYYLSSVGFTTSPPF